ncbi:GPI anchored serine-threonine rich protein [Peziza echinospora]|nr:GPI anchored serine-threonine rich protein [Peziza echinospora]
MKVFAIASAVLSIFAAVASAQEGVTWTKPNTEPEKGNVITRPGLYEKVPVGKPYTITWIPSGTEGPIDIVLYKGPGSNIIPQYALASKIPNTGTFVWTPETTFPDTKEGYGIRIIVVKDGQHQWSTQFGFSNPAETTTSASVPTGNTTSTKSATASASTSHSVTVSSNRTTTTTSKASTMTTVTTSASTLILTASETEEATTTAEPTGNTTTTTIASGNAAVATAVSYGMGVIAFAAAGMALL